MTTLRKGLSSEDLMTEPNQATLDNMQDVMVKKAQELFRVCDKEEKGFINKKDMQRLREELPVSPDQLEVVFDSLDDDGNGFLTLEEFTDGFGSFLGLTPKPPDEEDEPEFLGDDINSEFADESAIFCDMMKNVGAANVFQDEDVIKAMWRKLYNEDQEMSSTFEDFLGRLSDDIKRSKVDFKSLESALVSKSNEHEAEVRKLYEEMELQIKQEREKILAEEKLKEKQLKMDVETQLMEKERQLQDISTKHQEMEERLRHLNMAETSTKQENERLQKEKDRLEELLSRSQDDLEESRSYINQIQESQKDEKRERARQAIMMSEGIAIERETLVKQLDLLKDVNKKLRDDKDEADATEARRVEQTESDASSETSSRRGGRKELQKQGSVLSKYFPTSGPPPKYSSGSMDVDVSPMLLECEDDDEDVDNDVLKNANVFVPGSSSTPFTSSSNSNNEFIDTATTNNLHNSSADYATTTTTSTTSSSSSSSSNQQHQHHYESLQHQQQQDRNGCVTEGSHMNSVHASNRDAMMSEAGSTRTQPVGADAAQSENGEIQTPKPSRVFKVVIIGDSSVGKSTFMHRFCHHEFKGNFNATIGVDFQIKTMTYKGSTVILQLWDTAGQERFRSMTKTYFRKADGVIIMYDVTSEKTFMGVRHWMLSVQEQVEVGTVLALLGNKHDMASDEAHRPVKHKDGLHMAVEHDAIFYETSAKTGLNVIEAMEEMAKLLQEKEDKKLEEGLHLTDEKEVGKKKCCG